jgi:hypothetical protein
MTLAPMDAAAAASSDCLGCHGGDARVPVPDKLSITFPYSAAGVSEALCMMVEHGGGLLTLDPPKCPNVVQSIHALLWNIY